MADKVARVAFIADVTNFANNVDKAAAQTKGFQDTVGKMALPAAVAFGAVTAAAIDFSKAAAEDAKGAATLANALQNSTGATQEQIGAVEDWITKTSMATAVADDQLRPALATLARTTGDVSQAQELMGSALNIAAATGKPVEAVSVALSKAYAGNLGALNKLVPGIVDTTDKSLTFADAMAALDEKTKGAAETAAANDPWGQLNIALNETKEAIGAGILPLFQQFTPYLIQAATWAQENSRTLLILGGVIGGVAAAILAINAAMKVYQAVSSAVKLATAAWSAAQAILNVVLTANPIGLVIVAIAALIAGIVLAYQNSETFRRIVQAAFEVIKTTVLGVINWITTNVPAAFNTVVQFVAGLPDRLVAIGATIAEAITAPYRLAFNGIASLWNRTVGGFSFTVPSWIPVVGGRSFSIPNIPMLAEGGIVTGPTLAMIGEAGPEAVVPLNRGNVGTTIYVQGALDPVGVARQIKTILGQADLRLGYA